MRAQSNAIFAAEMFVALAAAFAGGAEQPPSAKNITATYPATLVEPLKFHDERIEVTEAGTLRRRYRIWGDFPAEMAAWKAVADERNKQAHAPPRTFRLGCVFLKNAEILCPDLPGMDGNALAATYTTPAYFTTEMREHTAPEFGDFVYAFTGGAVRCEWVFQTLEGLKWTSPGTTPEWGCQPRAIGDQLQKSLVKYADAHIDMWVWCAGRPRTLNGPPRQRIPGPPFGISYTQWQLFGGYNVAVCAPSLPLLVHEVNHRYLDNLNAIEGVQLTQFHGLARMGYEPGDLGYADLLATYRSVYLHIIRPSMWRRFSLTGPPSTKPEPFSGKLYRWADVSDDCWFRLPLLAEADLAKLTGLPTLKITADRNTRRRQFTVSACDRAMLRSPYAESAGDKATALNNVLSLATESCAVLRTATGHWLIVRPEVADVYVEMRSLHGRGAPLDVAGWLNDGVCPLLVLRAPPDLAIPANEVGYFR
ncbi:MAG TPA: hypothetical protein VG326_02245 [Tepidisphaeraceae bacterium]|nr:hypothetical protein [Tepidisphaeraceae bacterium]